MTVVLRRRHAVKSVSYRLVGTLQTALFSFLLTGSWKIASSLGVLELVIKPLVYFIHERIWYRWISYGIIKE